MSFIKKLLLVLVIMAAGSYAAIMWDAHQALMATSEKLARQIGAEVVDSLGDSSRSCRQLVNLDSVSVISDHPFSSSGSAFVYVSGGNGRAISLDYTIAVSGQKVYLKPVDHASIQSQIMQFASSGCR